MYYYRDQQQTQEILKVERQELEDWKEALGPGHFIVGAKMSVLCEKLVNIGMPNEALALIQGMYDRCKAVLSPDHVALDGLRNWLVKVHLLQGCDTEARQYLFELRPELKDENSRVELLGGGSDAVFLENFNIYTGLAILEDITNRPNRAKAVYRLIIPRVCKLLGDQNLRCINAKYSFVIHYERRCKYRKALEILDPLYKITVSNYGETHEQSLLIVQKRFELQARLRTYKGVPFTRIGDWTWYQLWFYKEPIEVAQACLGNDHPYTIMAINRGIAALAGNLRYEEAVELAICAVDLVEKRSGKNSHAAEYQRYSLKQIQNTAYFHNLFLTWGSWTFRAPEPVRFKGITVWWKPRKFEPFKLDLTLDPNYRADDVTT
ncbi:uncharacterized protein J4E78_005710 [Alternaria triticimaculans]|uniref:uncharacterized protein n=1 Tax=Alternaria triticimaculans TaxID=297637 RepID=UPI0020C4A121|nr:uncharacterized protein J4E78_005710 [Alternaria triticimaculans]KAI4659284.1 hypothetical protein J4E78_005710 [Alternaria triticimaculans]